MKKISPGLILLSIITGALTISWSLIFSNWVLEKMRVLNIWGIDANLFIIIVLGIVIVILTVVGVIKGRS